MKAFNIKLATFSFAALLLASCSDSNSDNGTEGSSIMNPKIVGSTVVSTTDAQTLATQVTNYKRKLQVLLRLQEQLMPAILIFLRA